MSNLVQTLASGDGFLKRFYSGPIQDTMNENCTAFRAFEKAKEGWTGSGFYSPVRVRRNQGVGSAAENALMPSSGRQTVVQASVTAASNYMSFSITGQMIKASQNDAGAFAKVFSSEMEFGAKDMYSSLNRQYGWSSSVGTLARVNTAAAASTSLVIKGRTTGEDPTQFLDGTLVIDIVNATTGVYAAQGVTINSVSYTQGATTATLTLDTPVTAAADLAIIVSGSYGNDITGVLAPLDGGTGTLYGINRATYQQFQGNYGDLSGAQLSLDAMQQWYNAGLKRGGSQYNAIWCDYASLRYHSKLLVAGKRYSNTTQGDGTFGKKDKFYMDFMGIPIVPDKDLPITMLFLQAETFKNAVLADFEFMDETGSSMVKIPGVDAYSVSARYFANLLCVAPASNARLTNYISP